MTPLAFRHGAVCLDGRPLWPLGAEVQYFRVRHPAGRAEATHRLWDRTLADVRACGLGWVSTYVPWDYHAPRRGEYDFTGPRDLDLFLRLCRRHDLWVALKPGPYITGEWPGGLGSFGALPGWLVADLPAARVRQADGRPWSFRQLWRSLRGPGLGTGKQLCLLDGDFLAAVAEWFARLAPIVRPHIEATPGVRLIQLDNETNLFWYDHYAIDHHPLWRRAFGPGDPPRRPPRRGEDPERHRRWFEAAQEGIAAYHARLKELWREQGIAEPEVRFSANDSPHGIPGRALVLADGTRKNRAALHGIDLYPRQRPDTRARSDQPFLGDFWVRAFARWSRRHHPRGAHDAGDPPVLALELQAGIFELPGGIPLPVPPELGPGLIVRLMGLGLAGAFIYVWRGGYNADGTRYDFQAPLAVDGAPRPHHEHFARIARRVLVPHGEAIARARPVLVDAAVLLEPNDRVPAPGAGRSSQRRYSLLPPALAGWFLAAGYPVDARVDAEDLVADPPKLLLRWGWRDLPERTRRAIAEIVQRTGMTLGLVLDRAEARGGRPSELTMLGERVRLVGADVVQPFLSGRYYGLAPGARERRSALARALAGTALGRPPLWRLTPPGSLATARVGAGETFLFLEGPPGADHLGIEALDEALLAPPTPAAGGWRVDELLTGQSQDVRSLSGIDVPLAAFGSAVVRICAAPSRCPWARIPP